jgi:hypothetical protein
MMIKKWIVFSLVVLFAAAFAFAKEPACKKIEALKAEFQNTCPDCRITIIPIPNGCQLRIRVPRVRYDPKVLTLDQQTIILEYLQNLDDLSHRFEALVAQLDSGLRPADLEQQLEHIRTDLTRTEDENIFVLYKSVDDQPSAGQVIEHLSPEKKEHFMLMKLRLGIVNADAGYRELRGDVKRLKKYTEEAIRSLRENYEWARIP